MRILAILVLTLSCASPGTVAAVVTDLETMDQQIVALEAQPQTPAVTAELETLLLDREQLRAYRDLMTPEGAMGEALTFFDALATGSPKAIGGSLGVIGAAAIGWWELRRRRKRKHITGVGDPYDDGLPS